MSSLKKLPRYKAKQHYYSPHDWYVYIKGDYGYQTIYGGCTGEAPDIQKLPEIYNLVLNDTARLRPEALTVHYYNKHELIPELRISMMYRTLQITISMIESIVISTPNQLQSVLRNMPVTEELCIDLVNYKGIRRHIDKLIKNLISQYNK